MKFLFGTNELRIVRINKSSDDTTQVFYKFGVHREHLTLSEFYYEFPEIKTILGQLPDSYNIDEFLSLLDEYQV